MGKLTAAQEVDIARRALAGERYDQLIGDLAGQGVTYSKPAITKLVHRVQARALAAPPEPATDPQTGVEVEVTDELLLVQMARDLSREYHKQGRVLEDKISIAHALPKVILARQKVRQPPNHPRPPERPQPSEPPPSPSEPEELIRFN